jgi:hypothetical protein
MREPALGILAATVVKFVNSFSNPEYFDIPKCQSREVAARLPPGRKKVEEER